MKKVLVIGASGMLGHKLVQVLGEKFEVFSTIRGGFQTFENIEFFRREKTFENIDVASFDEISGVIEKTKPNFVLNAVGVVKQIPSAKDVVRTLSINSIFPQKLADEAARSGFKLINISTDCVFDGKKGNYSEDDLPDALDLYGKSKNFGEVSGKNCLTLRTSIIGRELETSHSLVEWFISKKGDRIKGFKRAIYSGFPTVVLARIIGEIIERHAHLEGLYHVSSEPISKFELLNLINREFGLGVTIEPDSEFVLDRSLNSDRFRRETGFMPQSWAEMIKIMSEDAAPYRDWRKKLKSV